MQHNCCTVRHSGQMLCTSIQRCHPITTKLQEKRHHHSALSHHHFYSTLFYSILFYSILSSHINTHHTIFLHFFWFLFYSILFYSIQLYSPSPQVWVSLSLSKRKSSPESWKKRCVWNIGPSSSIRSGQRYVRPFISLSCQIKSRYCRSNN